MKPYQASIMNAFCLRNICEDITDYADVDFLFSKRFCLYSYPEGWLHHIITPWVCPNIFGLRTANCVFKLAIYGGETPNLLVLIIRSDQKDIKLV